MKKTSLKVIVFILMAVFTAVEFALASDSISVSVSCTIPAVPGLNAPPFDEETKKAATTAAVQAENKAETHLEKNPSAQTPVIIQEEREMKTVSNEGRTSAVDVLTMYSR